MYHVLKQSSKLNNKFRLRLRKTVVLPAAPYDQDRAPTSIIKRAEKTNHLYRQTLGNPWFVRNTDLHLDQLQERTTKVR